MNTKPAPIVHWTELGPWVRDGRATLAPNVPIQCGPHWFRIGVDNHDTNARIGGIDGQLVQVFAEPRSAAIKATIRELKRLRKITDAAIEALESKAPKRKGTTTDG